MKTIKVLLTGTALSLAFCCTNALMAQDAGRQENIKQQKDKGMVKEECMATMVNGQMMQMKLAPMEKDITLNNGDIVMTNGSIMKQNGKKEMLKEGECVNLNGRVMDNRMMKERAQGY